MEEVPSAPDASVTRAFMKSVERAIVQTFGRPSYRGQSQQGVIGGMRITNSIGMVIENGSFSNLDVAIEVNDSTGTQIISSTAHAEDHMADRETKNVVVNNSPRTEVVRPKAVGLHTNVEVNDSPDASVVDAVALSNEAHLMSLQLEGYIAQLRQLGSQQANSELVGKLEELNTVLKREGKGSPIVQYLAGGATTLSRGQKCRGAV